jgi:hypothetical protein
MSIMRCLLYDSRIHGVKTFPRSPGREAVSADSKAWSVGHRGGRGHTAGTPPHKHPSYSSKFMRDGDYKYVACLGL